ncbi:hypothetical protein C8T65DRAFT_272910 [Cerioporus squamosus]|nr:hypothetical protein C8T65DRAFT_272910 [Cerioporus squamosus]
MLNLTACTKLESISLPIHFRENPTRPLSETLVEILQQTPPSLRKITINVYGLLESTAIKNRKVFKMQDLDKLLSPTRFPHLQECEFKICDWMLQWHRKDYWPKCVDSVQRALKVSMLVVC